MNLRGLTIGVCLAGLALTLAGCDVVSGPGTLAGTITYAKDPAGSLTDPGNAGSPAAGAKVLVYGTEKQNAPGAVGVYIENRVPAKEVTTDGQGRYTVELPAGRYVVRLEPDPKTYHRFADIGPMRTTVTDFIILPPGSVAPTPLPGPTPTPPAPASSAPVPQPYPIQ